MARRTLVDDLVVLPWWVLIVIAAVVYVTLTYLIANIDAPNIYLQSLFSASVNVAVPLSLLILFFACISALQAWCKREMLEKQSGVDSIRDLSWQQFEWLVGEAYKRRGYAITQNGGAGPDDGIDLVLIKADNKILVQCKNWRTTKVGVGVVRELLGAMTAKDAKHGFVVCSGDDTKPAQIFAKENHIVLINGAALTTLIGDVQQSNNVQKSKAINTPTNNTPTKILCPICNSTMVRRTAKRGARAGRAFWGCSQFPKCKGTIN